MGDGFFVVTATKVNLTGEISFKFMFDGQMPRDKVGHSKLWGCVVLREFGRNEFRPFDLGKSDKTSEGTRQWVISVGNATEGQLYSGGCDEDTEEVGLSEMLKEIPACILLMEELIYERFRMACERAGLPVDVHSFAGELSTS